MSTTPHTPPISSPPGQEDQSARLAASAEVGQVEGTFIFSAPRGFIDPTRPERVQRVYSCRQSFQAYIDGLQAGGLHIQISSPNAAAYARGVRA